MLVHYKQFIIQHARHGHKSKQNPHFLFNYLFPKVVPFLRQCGENVVQPGSPQMTIWRMRIACWIPKATNTHSEHVILIAFPLQQWLRERASMLHLCVHC